MKSETRTLLNTFLGYTYSQIVHTIFCFSYTSQRGHMVFEKHRLILYMISMLIIGFNAFLVYHGACYSICDGLFFIWMLPDKRLPGSGGEGEGYREKMRPSPEDGKHISLSGKGRRTVIKITRNPPSLLFINIIAYKYCSV